MTPWYASRYSGLFSSFGQVSLRPHDPAVVVYSGEAPRDGLAPVQASGIGWTQEAAEAACVGEAIERFQAHPLPPDRIVTASHAGFPGDEPALEPGAWVLFHEEQYRQPGFPFRPFTRETVCPWVCCREVGSGRPGWLPAEMVYLDAGRFVHQIGPGLSTGLAAGRFGDPVLLRGLLEVLERDAVVGAWWGRYPLEEFSFDEVVEGLGRQTRGRVVRPNLTYRCYRIRSPFAAHVALVTLTGEDREGWCFSAGSACRLDARSTWEKALLEAIHGRFYVRHLLEELRAQRRRLDDVPTDFWQHAVWYSVHSEMLARTILGRATDKGRAAFPPHVETLSVLLERLGSERPVFFRDMTPPAFVHAGLGWQVLRVLVPGLQPLHGHHHLAHLGGGSWAPRGLAEWHAMPPHPFP